LRLLNSRVLVQLIYFVLESLDLLGLFLKLKDKAIEQLKNSCLGLLPLKVILLERIDSLDQVMLLWWGWGSWLHFLGATFLLLLIWSRNWCWGWRGSDRSGKSGL